MPEKTRRRLRLKTTEFDDLAERTFGSISQREIGKRMGVGESAWSLMRGGKRYVSNEFVGRFVESWPRHNIADYIDVVPEAEQ